LTIPALKETVMN